MFNFETLQKQNQANIESATKSYEAVSKGVQEVSKEAMDFTKKQAEDTKTAFEKLTASKSVEKAIEVQTDYAKSSFEGYVAHATKMNEMYMDFAKQAFAPFEKAVAVSAK